MKLFRWTFLVSISLLIINCNLVGQMKNELPQISVRANQFVDVLGNSIIFRGVSTSDPDKLIKEGKWNKNLFEELKNWNVNLVRFPVHPIAWRERGEENYLKLLDDGIKWASELGIYVIIDWHSIGNLRTELYQHPMYNTTKTETFRFWKTIAAKYNGNSTVAFYELFNEPTTYNGTLGKISWQQHKELMEEIIGIIYAHDTNKIPIVAGFNWAYELTDVKFEPIAYPNVAYVTHPYPQKREKPWEEKWEQDWGFVADHYPIIATELGFMKADGPGAHIPVIVEDEEYGETIVNYFNKKGISWVAWVFDPFWSPQLIESWNFEPTMQGKFFKQKLIELNK
ncbi:MAG: cellulase family glycosylhydrolase [Ignavibacteriae bacterium]|nr:cellulase family glycosylhydrolase [Ignavibacteriota bacterium]